MSQIRPRGASGGRAFAPTGLLDTGSISNDDVPAKCSRGVIRGCGRAGWGKRNNSWLHHLGAFVLTRPPVESCRGALNPNVKHCCSEKREEQRASRNEHYPAAGLWRIFEAQGGRRRLIL